jgi:hypothetical protein
MKVTIQREFERRRLHKHSGGSDRSGVEDGFGRIAADLESLWS